MFKHISQYDCPVFIDIDGTLTDKPNATGGNVIPTRIAGVTKLIEDGLQVVLWSMGGTEYAQDFAKKNKLNVLAAIGKPILRVDDDPEGGMQYSSIVSPSELDKIV